MAYDFAALYGYVMESKMSNQAHSAQQFDVDFTPALRMYLESINAWKKNYEALLANADTNPAKNAPDPFGRGHEQAITTWQEAGGDAFKRLVEQQVELCRFFGRRWASYLDLPEMLLRCKTPAEFAQLQLDFLNRMGAEYMQESVKLTQPLTEMAADWITPRSAH